jgi:hypothetical protein
MMAMPKGAIATIAIIITFMSLTASAGARVTTVGVGVYSNSACTIQLSTISWGTISPGIVKTYTAYVKNTGNVPITLNMIVSSWNPTIASKYITLTWNRGGTVLSAGQEVIAVLTLTVSSSIKGITSFSFSTVITGTQHQ